MANREFASRVEACSPGGCAARRREGTAGVALASGLLAALLPKCPLCIAAWLAAFGVSLGSASVALGLLRPIALALAVAALLVAVVHRRQRTQSNT